MNNMSGGLVGLIACFSKVKYFCCYVTIINLFSTKFSATWVTAVVR